MSDESRIEKKKKDKKKKRDKDSSNIFSIIGIILILIVLGVVFYFSVLSGSSVEVASNSEFEGLEALESAEDPTLVAEGTSNEELNDMVHIVYYGDYGCPYCASFETSENFEHIKEEYIRSGEASLTYRSISLIDPRNSQLTALADRSVWNNYPNEYWRWHKTTYLNQGSRNWASTNQIKKWTNKIGLDGNRVVQEIRTRKYQNEVNRNNNLYNKQATSGTPQFIIGNTTVNPNDIEEVGMIIERQKE